jgi:hypothetical protein
VGKGALAPCPPSQDASKMVSTRSLSWGAHSRDPLALPTLRLRLMDTRVEPAYDKRDRYFNNSRVNGSCDDTLVCRIRVTAIGEPSDTNFSS